MKRCPLTRFNLACNDGNPVTSCRTYEKTAWHYNYVRSNNPNWLSSIRPHKGHAWDIESRRQTHWATP